MNKCIVSCSSWTLGAAAHPQMSPLKPLIKPVALLTSRHTQWPRKHWAHHPTLQCATRCHVVAGKFPFFTVTLEATLPHASRMPLHPKVLDSCMLYALHPKVLGCDHTCPGTVAHSYITSKMLVLESYSPALANICKTATFSVPRS